MAEETKTNITGASAASESTAAAAAAEKSPMLPGTEKPAAGEAAAASAAGAAKAAGKLMPAEAISPAPAPKPAAAAHKKEAKSLKPETPTQPGAIIIEDAIEIAAPLESAWRLFLNYVKWPDWNPVIRSVRSLVQGTAFGLGWRFELKLKCGPLPLRFEAVVLENTTPNVIRWLGSFTGVHGMHWFIFEKTEAGCRVTTYEEITGPLRFIPYLMRPWTRRMMRTWLEALKAHVEKQESADKKSPPLKPSLPLR